jgi:hypothetical protein
MSAAPLPEASRLPVHMWDTTGFCLHCGAAKLDAETLGRKCTTGQNVHGASHLIARRLLAERIAREKENTDGA